MPRSTKRAKKPADRDAGLPKPDDFRTYLLEKASLIAPGDVTSLLAQRTEALRTAAQGGATHPRLRPQTEVAYGLLADHQSGDCPQVPYHTVSLLAVALLYLLAPMDVVPDWIPGVGTSDDALVLELAFELGAPGIERYCTAKGISMDGLFTRKE